jgi:hypothetical protein
LKVKSCGYQTLFSCLEKQKVLTPINVRMLEIFVDTWHCSPLQAIIDTHLMTEPELANVLATMFQMDRLYSLKNHRVDQKSIELLSFKESKENVAVLLVDESGRYDLVVADPSDQEYITGLRSKVTVSFTLAVCERREIVRAIDEKYPLVSQLPTMMGV